MLRSPHWSAGAVAGAATTASPLPLWWILPGYTGTRRAGAVMIAPPLQLTSGQRQS